MQSSSTFVSLFLYRLMSSMGELYYLLLVPLVFLYVGIFLSNKLHSHQQQRQQQRDVTHSDSTARRRHSASPPAAIADVSASLARASSVPGVDTSSPLHSRALPLSPSPHLSSSSAQSDTELSSREEEQKHSSPSADVDSSSALSLRFLLPDQSMVSHSFPSDPLLEVSAVLHALYPADPQLVAASRLIYQGRLMRADTALAEYELSDGDVVHVHHVTLPASHAAGTRLLPSAAELAALPPSPPAPLLLLLSVLAALLGAGWGLYWSVGGRLFDAASTLLLLCMSSLTAAGVLFGYALQQPPHRAAVINA